jgi:uncharacterized membrane protein
MFAFLARSTFNRGSNLMAKAITFGSSVVTSRNKRLVTISLQLESPEESMTITVSVPNDGKEQDLYALSFARARDFARHFLELPFECPQGKAYRAH